MHMATRPPITVAAAVVAGEGDVAVIHVLDFLRSRVNVQGGELLYRIAFAVNEDHDADDNDHSSHK